MLTNRGWSLTVLWFAMAVAFGTFLHVQSPQVAIPASWGLLTLLAWWVVMAVLIHRSLRLSSPL